MRLPGRSRAPISISVWNTDSSGNYISDYRRRVGNQHCVGIARDQFPSGLERRRGDRCSGTVIEAIGSTSLVEVGNHFFLDSISSGTGPSLKYAGADFVAGQFGDWTPIGAEQTASGYEVAWKIRRCRSVFGLDHRQQRQLHLEYCRYVGQLTSTLESFEPSFHQDLNGDGVIGAGTSAKSAMTLNSGASTDSPSMPNLFASDTFKFAGLGPNETHAGLISGSPNAIPTLIASAVHAAMEMGLDSVTTLEQHLKEASIHPAVDPLGVGAADNHGGVVTIPINVPHHPHDFHI